MRKLKSEQSLSFKAFFNTLEHFPGIAVRFRGNQWTLQEVTVPSQEIVSHRHPIKLQLINQSPTKICMYTFSQSGRAY